MSESALIVRMFDGVEVPQRRADRYLNATAACKANGKLWADYWRNKATQEFLTELSRSMGIPIDLLTEVRRVGANADRGTWVHPRIAMHLAQWLSPRFAVAVAAWLEELLMGDHEQPKFPSTARLLVAQAQLLLELEERQAAQAEQLGAVEARACAADHKAEAALQAAHNNHGHYSVLGYSRLCGLVMTLAEASRHGRQLTAHCRSIGQPIGTVRDPRFGYVHTYPEPVLEEYFGAVLRSGENEEIR